MAEKMDYLAPVLPVETERITGEDALQTNIKAAQSVAECVKSTLGPSGMDKLLIDDSGEIIVTNDGATILKELDIEHPAAKMMVEVAATQDEEVGDGTTTAVIIAGELLKGAEKLLGLKIHSSVIVKGYQLAAEKAHNTLRNNSLNVSADDENALKKIATTALLSKGADEAHLAHMAVRAVKFVSDRKNREIKTDLDSINVVKIEGGGTADTQLLEGVVIDKGKAHPSMPDSVKNAKILLVNSALGVKGTKVDAQVRITNPKQLRAFLSEEEKALEETVKRIKDSGANALFVQKGIDDLAEHHLAKAGIFCLKQVKKSNMEKLSKATGAKIVTSLDDLTADDLGLAGFIEVIKIGGDEVTVVKECRDPKSVSVLVRGGSEHILDETERSLQDALKVVASAVKDQSIVAGGGALEAEAAKVLREYARSIKGKEQLAVDAFAESLEAIPCALAENAGLDPIDVMVEIRSKHEGKGGARFGLDVNDGKVKDMAKEGVIEPLKVKVQA
ncbi:MAG: thermosome subunit beta, partial [Thermodesulfobacteriota bacterium]